MIRSAWRPVRSRASATVVSAVGLLTRAPAPAPAPASATGAAEPGKS
ncbi:hypothetical protein [Virgisporangium aliadipatigenens]|nr:hypothetical protein [Virgisporangium aliadipatigenens]